MLFSAAALLTFIFTAHSQDVKFGVKAGLNIADWGGDAEDTNVRAGFNAGVVAEIKYGNFAVQPEVLYSQQGSELEVNYFTGTTLDGSVNYTTKLNYINVPVALKYYIVEGLSLQAGPQIGFLINAEEKSEITADGESETNEVDAKNNYEKIDFSVFGGVGYDLPMGVFFQVRYIAGLSNINKDPETANIELSNNVLSFSVGYKF